MKFTATLTNNFSPPFWRRLKTKVRLSTFQLKKRFFLFYVRMLVPFKCQGRIPQNPRQVLLLLEKVILKCLSHPRSNDIFLKAILIW